MDKKLIRYSVMPLNAQSDEIINQICNDIQKQYEDGFVDLAIFSMSLHPDSNPVRDKVTGFCDTYLKISNELEKRGLKCGVLIQSTIGHGAHKSNTPFQEYIKFTDGKGDGICCPMDENFKKYIYDCVVKVAECKPAVFLVDDDFRLMARGGKSCACPMHMAKFNELNGTNLSREELFNIVTSDDSRCEDYTKKFIKVQYDSLEDLAKVIRDAFDSVDPTIQGVFCSGGDDVVNISKILAGKGNPSIARIGNGSYSYNSTSGFSYAMLRAAIQNTQFKGVDYLIAETDTCPQNRYSKTAKQLHAHYVGSILEGIKGAKHWITRLTKCENIEWESGVAYRKILKKNNGLYETVASLVDGVTWHGFKIPVQKQKTLSYKSRVYFEINNFAEKCFERLGLPMFFGNDNGGITCFVDGNDYCYNDEELLNELKGKAIFSSETAKKVAERGFEKYLGVKIEEFEDIKPGMEIVYPMNNTVAVQQGSKKLVQLDNSAYVPSKYFKLDSNNNQIFVSPSAVEYKNELGGYMVTFAGTPNCENTFFQGYSFFNQTRKNQLINILKQSGEPVIYYPGDEGVYLKTGTLSNGNNFTAIFNLCYDEIEQVKLVYPTKPSKVSFIDCDGSIKEIPFTYENGTIYVDKTLNCLDTLFLIIK
ncbi:MAG: hypothetical protein IKV61_05335 [Clostridia bacterium]|nr:hypothetical protein [Clostridia bacterium]